MKKRRKYAGRRLIFWGALALAAWCGYELYVRLDAMLPPLKMFFALVTGEGIALETVMKYWDWTIFSVPAFLANCAAFALLSLALRNRPIGGLALVAGCVGIALWGLGVDSLAAADLTQILRAAPLMSITAGCVVNMACLCVDKRRARRARHIPGPGGKRALPGGAQRPRFVSVTYERRAAMGGRDKSA